MMLGFRPFLCAATVAISCALPQLSAAQDQTLADIRQELSVLYVEVQRLRTELSTTSGGFTNPTQGGSALERLTAIERELQRLTSKAEELEFRVDRVVRDGTNRVGDLEFRLCELEADCDITQLGDTPSLGGVDAATTGPIAQPAPDPDGPALAIGERADFERAQAALNTGDFRAAADQFAAFSEAYPGGPLSAEAHYLRGTALEGLGETTGAARAYLDAFSGAPTGDRAPEALYKLGASLGALGQTRDACTTLGEVAIRFPASPAVLQAQSSMRNLGCS
jgi:tol-pal system protein YbgF